METKDESINQDWIQERANELEQIFINIESVPFKINEAKEYGFITRVKGLFCYISYVYMPWGYDQLSHWTTIAPYLVGKVLWGKINSFSKDPLRITLNGKIPQFRISELNTNQLYRGIVYDISPNVIWVEFGIHFDWKCGSIKGIIPKHHFSQNETKSDFTIGQELYAIFFQVNPKGYNVFSRNPVKIDWQLGNPQKMIGQKVKAVVFHDPKFNKLRLLIDDKYVAVLLILKKDYTNREKREVLEAIYELQDGDVIESEVVEVVEEKGIFKVKWLYEFKPIKSPKEKKQKRRTEKTKRDNFNHALFTPIEELIDIESREKIYGLKKKFSNIEY